MPSIDNWATGAVMPNRVVNPPNSESPVHCKRGTSRGRRNTSRRFFGRRDHQQPIWLPSGDGKNLSQHLLLPCIVSCNWYCLNVFSLPNKGIRFGLCRSVWKHERPIIIPWPSHAPQCVSRRSALWFSHCQTLRFGCFNRKLYTLRITQFAAVVFKVSLIEVLLHVTLSDMVVSSVDAALE